MHFADWLKFWVIVYVLAINTVNFVLLVMGLRNFLRFGSRRRGMAQYEVTQFSNPMPAISVLAPAYNEAKTIRESMERKGFGSSRTASVSGSPL
jgi:cellulose synthase/poly-beta-1,6-N-acetylglucosamine synthase-like glycosyltransferase